MNKLQQIFYPESELNKKLEEDLEKLIQKMILNHDCYYCTHCVFKENIYEQGKWCGYNCYCDIFNERIKNNEQQLCLFWRSKNEAVKC